MVSICCIGINGAGVPVQIEFSGNGVTGTQFLRAYAARRLGFALGRFSTQVTRVRVRVADVNGPRGGIDASCRIQVWGAGIDELVVTVLAVDYPTAINQAADRIGRMVARRLARVSDRHRGRGRHPGRPSEERGP